MVNPVSVFEHNLKLEVSESKHAYVFITLLAIGLIVLSTQKLPLDQFQGIGSLGSNIAMYTGAGLIVLIVATPFIIAKRLSRPLEDEDVEALSLVINKKQFGYIISKKDGKKYTMQTKGTPIDLNGLKPLPTRFYKATIALKSQLKEPIARQLNADKVAAYRGILNETEEFLYREIGGNGALNKVKHDEDGIEEVGPNERISSCNVPTDLLELRLQNLPKESPKA